jgi:hypothetical protein
VVRRRPPAPRPQLAAPALPLAATSWSRDHRPGRKPALSDAELACVAVAQHLLGIASERRWIRYARANLVGMFPRLPG